MRRLGPNVKRLASLLALWQLAQLRRQSLAKDAEDKERIKAERLREALRANLRRRKARPPQLSAEHAAGRPLVADPDPGT